MKKIKNKFLYFLFFLIFSLIGSVFYMGIFGKNIDRNSYAELISGTGSINKQELVIGEKVQIKKGDNIKTSGTDSMIIIEWGDGSITRLGENTSMTVEQNNFSEDGNIIQVVFKVFSGKTWSNVVSYIPGESYFIQAFDDIEVAVRGTIFTLDLDKEYIYVESHKVLLKDSSGNSLELEEKKPLSTKSFDFISLENFILSFKDKLFFEKNIELDKQLYILLKKELDKQIKNLKQLQELDISNLGTKELEETYANILSMYQKLNFISTKDGQELFGLKIDVKKKLMELASIEEKKNLAQSFFYDIKDTIESGKFYSFDSITNILIENKAYFDFESFIELLSSLKIQENLEKAVQENIEDLHRSFKITTEVGGKIINKINELDKQARDGIFNIKEKAEKTIEKGLNDVIKTTGNLENEAQKNLQNGINEFEGFLKNTLKINK